MNRNMIPYIDIHTHKHPENPDEMAIISLDVEAEPLPMCSIGIHPWRTQEANKTPHFIEKSLQLLASKATDPRVMAIGEAGMDKMQGADPEVQRNLFERQALIAEQVGKPLVIHVVKFVDEIVEIHKKLKPTNRWIIHGFRGKPMQAQTFIDRGIDLSFGQHYNPQSLIMAYESHRLWLETDQSDMTITSHYQSVSHHLGLTPDDLKLTIYHQASSLFGKL